MAAEMCPCPCPRLRHRGGPTLPSRARGHLANGRLVDRVRARPACLDFLVGDFVPGISPITGVFPEELYARAEAAIEVLALHGSDPLGIELLLADLEDARGSQST